MFGEIQLTIQENRKVTCSFFLSVVLLPHRSKENRRDGHCLDKDEQVEELVIDATLRPAQREFRHGYA